MKTIIEELKEIEELKQLVIPVNQILIESKEVLNNIKDNENYHFNLNELEERQVIRYKQFIKEI